MKEKKVDLNQIGQADLQTISVRIEYDIWSREKYKYRVTTSHWILENKLMCFENHCQSSFYKIS